MLEILWYLAELIGVMLLCLVGIVGVIAMLCLLVVGVYFAITGVKEL